jgi:uracil-DNA glycosylase
MNSCENYSADIIEMSSSIENLSSIISSCKKCDLYKEATMAVPGLGNDKAKVIFIGEGPGKKEDQEGKPFVGTAGNILTELLESVGLKREEVFITNIVKHRPPNNRDPLPNEVEACFVYLKRQIELINPNLIVFLGRHALNRFFPEEKISQCHGKAFKKEISWLKKEQLFLALYHPAAALYQSSLKKTLKEDFKIIPKLITKLN